MPADLPIYELENQFVDALRASNRVMIQAPTGSGKSTQIPQWLVDHGFAETGEVVVLQPRRLATRVLAARVAWERNGRVGDEVGYQIRMDRVCSAKTKIRFVTEGVLLRQMLGDPGLRGIATIVFDEFHERHLHGDITLAKALDLQESKRPDLKLIVMSATLDGASLAQYLAPCETLTSAGRSFPVEIRYLERGMSSNAQIWDAVAEEFEKNADATTGDTLIFMPGAYKIQRTISAVRNTRAGSKMLVVPLHGELPAKDQDAALSKYNQRKVVVSTNVAETSLTIDGVTLVIDSGLARIARFDPNRGINTLFTERISRAAADQRAGRAGRTAPGVCLRMWTEREHYERPAQESPEVKRLDLAEVVLTLKATGATEVRDFRWLESPESRALERAELLLTDLGAIDAEGVITELGRRMLAFPVHPRYARMLLAADQSGCVAATCMVAALTQGKPLLFRAAGKEQQEHREKAFGDETSSDFLTLIRAQRYAEQAGFHPEKLRSLGINGIAAREAGALADQFLRIAKDEKLNVLSRDEDSEAIARCILAGFPDQVGVRMDSGTLRVQLVHQRRGVLARESVVQDSRIIVAGEIRETEGRDGVQTLLTLATAIDEKALADLFPEAFSENWQVAYDSTQRRVMGTRSVCFRDLILREERTDKVPAEEAAVILAGEVVAGRLKLENWNHEVEQWILRLNQLANWCPEYELPKIDGDDRVMLIQQLCHGASSYREIKDRAVWPVLKSWLSPMQQELLETQAPERLELPGGRKAKITYAESGKPTLGARIQDLYGVTDDLRIAGRKVALLIQVLAPNFRPIQITENLRNFWESSYPKIRQELSRKYPKHEWR